jgi:hypothetical protein
MALGLAPNNLMTRLVQPPNDLRSAYEDFLEAFRSAAEDANKEVQFSNVPLPSCFTAPGDNAIAEFTTFVYLKDWPCKRLQGSKRLDVVIKARERFRRGSEWQLTKSTVYLNYLVDSGSGCQLVQSLHYDFEEPGQPGHPFFHVHLNVEPIPRDELVSKGINLDFDVPHPERECFVTTRIPTADMTFASVLYCLMADHLGSDTTGSGAGIFAGFAKEVQKIENRLPSLSFDALRDSLQRSFGNFKSPHWFAHMF